MTQYCGICITDTHLYVTVSEQVRYDVNVTQRYVRERSTSLATDLAHIHASNKYIPTIYSMTYTEEPQFILKPITSNAPVQTTIQEKNQAILDHNNTYAYEFILPTINNQRWLFMVGLPLSKVNELLLASANNDMETEIVSFCPAPLLDLQDDRKKPTLILIEEKRTVKGYLCHNAIVVAKTQWDKEFESPSVMIQRLLALSPIEMKDQFSIQYYLTDKTYSAWEHTLLPYDIISNNDAYRVQNYATQHWIDNAYMNAAAGLSCTMARLGIESEEL